MIFRQLFFVLCLITIPYLASALAPYSPPPITYKDGVLHLPVRGEITAAVFERGPKTWVIQNTPQFWPKKPIAELDANVYHQQFASAISMTTPKGTKPIVTYTKDGIEVKFAVPVNTEATPTQFTENIKTKDVEFTLPVTEKPGNVVKFQDPDHDDTLVVLPWKTSNYRVASPHKFKNFTLLPSVLGLVFEPDSDDLHIEAVPGQVTVSNEKKEQVAYLESSEAFIPVPVKPEGMIIVEEPVDVAQVIPQEEQKIEEELPPTAPHPEPLQVTASEAKEYVFLEPFLRVEEWETNIPFVDRLNELQEGVYDRRQGKYNIDAAYNLVRFYVTYGMPLEAKNVIVAILGQNPELEKNPVHIGLTALIHAMNEDYYDANKLMKDPVLDKDPRVVSWRWATDFLQKFEEGDKTAKLPGTVNINHLPHDIIYAVLSRLLKNALRVEDFDTYVSLSELARFHAKQPKERFYLSYLDGWHNYLIDQTDTAFEIWEYVGEHGDRLNSVQARYAYAYKGIEAAKLTRAEVENELEYLTYAWRGDDFEHKTRYMLAKLMLEDSRIRDALLQLKTLITEFPNHPQAAEVTNKMTDAYVKYMLRTTSDLPPIDVLSMFEEFKELTPIGEKGDEIYFKVANLYLDLELPDEAAPILQHLMQFKLKGERKADAGMKLCSIYADKAAWDDALTALTSSEEKELSEDVICERDTLRANVLLNQKQYDTVLKMLEGKADSDSLRLQARANIGLENWSKARNIYEELLRTLPEEEINSQQSQHDILNYAIALVFDMDFVGLKNLREQYGEEMKKGKYAQPFDLVASSISTDKVKDLSKDVKALTTLYKKFKSGVV